MIDTNELRRLAQAATPGPWKAGQYLGSLRQFVIHTDVGDKGRGSDVAFTSAAFGNDETVANARIIAAANPAAITELLDRLEAAEKERDALRTELNEIRYGVAVAHDTIKTLRAKIEHMEKQEPVAEWVDGAFDQYPHLRWRESYKAIVGAKLYTKFYALPGAQTQGEEK